MMRHQQQGVPALAGAAQGDWLARGMPLSAVLACSVMRTAMRTDDNLQAAAGDESTAHQLAAVRAFLQHQQARSRHAAVWCSG